MCRTELGDASVQSLLITAKKYYRGVGVMDSTAMSIQIGGISFQEDNFPDGVLILDFMFEDNCKYL